MSLDEDSLITNMTLIGRFLDAIGELSDIREIVGAAQRILPELFRVDRAEVHFMEATSLQVGGGGQLAESRSEGAGGFVDAWDLVGRCFASGDTVIVDHLPVETDGKASCRAKSSMAVPVKSGKSVIGVLRLDDCQGHRRFTGVDEAVGEAIGTLLGMVIQHNIMAPREGEGKEPKEELRRAEERQRVAMAAARMGYWDWDVAADRLVYQSGLPVLYGFEPDYKNDALRKQMHDRIHPEDAPLVEAAIERAMAGHPFDVQFRVMLPTGEIRWLNGTGSAIFNDQKQAERLVGVNIDITDRKLGELALQKSEERFRALADAMPQIVWMASPDGQITYFNKRWKEFTGTDLEACKVSGWASLMHPEDRDDTILAWTDAVREGRPYQIEHRIRNATDSSYRWFLTRAYPSRDVDGSMVCWYGTSTDIDEKKAVEQAMMRASEELEQRVTERTRALEATAHAFKLLNDMSEQLHACETHKEAYLVVLGVAQQLFPVDSGAMFAFDTSRNLLDVVLCWGADAPIDKVFDPDGCWAVRRGRVYKHSSAFAGPVCTHTEIEQGADASYVCVPMTARGEMFGVLYLRSGTAADDSTWPERQELVKGLSDAIVQAISNLTLRQELKAQSVRDPLTGLYNRRHMIGTVQRELLRADRLKQEVSLMMIDIDHFKMFNDRHGHEAGDRMLVAVAEYLRKRMRGDDVASRYGGEEFTVVMFSAGTADALAKADVMRDELRTMDVYHFGQSIGSVTLSIGIATFPEHGTTVEELLRAADDALYKAKAAGRDRAMAAGTAAAASEN